MYGCLSGGGGLRRGSGALAPAPRVRGPWRSTGTLHPVPRQGRAPVTLGPVGEGKRPCMCSDAGCSWSSAWRSSSWSRHDPWARLGRGRDTRPTPQPQCWEDPVHGTRTAHLLLLAASPQGHAGETGRDERPRAGEAHAASPDPGNHLLRIFRNHLVSNIPVCCSHKDRCAWQA